MSRFGTFWKGPSLSAFESACLHSFVAAGQEVTLFSYEPVLNVPAGVRIEDARMIADEARMASFRVAGAASVSHFSDYFRYVMFARTDLTWIDTDVMLLRAWQQDPDRALLALETPDSLCNAVMRLPSGEPVLAELIARTEAKMNTDMRWGDTGPRLITRLIANHPLMAAAKPPHQHFPIHFDDFWKVFLPAHAEECQTQCSAACSVHLWNNIVDRLGFWKEFLPPAGSYLNELFVATGCEGLFRGTFPLSNMQQLVDNWQSRQTGRHLGVRSVVQQLVPSIGRTIRHYAG